MHRRIPAFLLAALLALTLASCGKQELPTPVSETQTQLQTTAARDAEGDIAAPQQQAPTTEPEAAQTTAAAAQTTAAPVSGAQTGPLFQKYVRDKVADGTYTLRTEQSGMKIIVTTDGADSAIESDAAGLLRFALIHRGGEYAMVMHNSKKYCKMTEAEYAKQVNTLGSSAIDLEGMRFRSSGTQTVNGKRYDVETYDEGDLGVVTYFFDETGVQRTRVIKDGKTNETDVFVVSGDADASAFEIPQDYTAVSDPTQLLT